MSQMPFTKEDLEAHWHLDRRVPLAVLIVLAVQTGGFFWWAGATNERMAAAERAIAANASAADRLTRVEVKVDTIVESVAEIKTNLRKPIN